MREPYFFVSKDALTWIKSVSTHNERKAAPDPLRSVRANGGWGWERCAAACASVAMPLFTIRITNSDFDTKDEYEHPDLETAKEQALKGALQMGADEVVSGHPFFGAEVCVTQGGEQRARFVVSVGASPLQ
jgi:hypothetical protein